MPAGGAFAAVAASAVPPPLAGELVRSRLIQRIHSTAPRGLCAITGHPGQGATVALAQALRSSGEAATWLHLDGVGDVTIDVPHVVDHATTLRDPAAMPPDPERGGGVLGDNRPHGGHASWLVLDGLDPATHTALVDDLPRHLAALPPGLRVAITSHSQLPPRLLLAAGPLAVTVIGPQMLRFTDDEAAGLLRGLGLDPGSATAAAMISAAEGWSAALALAGVQSLLDGRDAEWLTGSGSVVLFGDWFRFLPEHLQRFLTRTAALDLLSAEPAQHLLDPGEDAGAMLLQLQERHAFLEETPAPRRHTGRWWRRHGLLTAFLRQSTTAHSDERDRAAAEWFLRHGDQEAALRHYLAAGNVDRAAALLAEFDVKLTLSGQADQVLRWYAGLPPDHQHTPRAALGRGWASAIAGDPAAARLALAEARQADAAAAGGADLLTGYLDWCAADLSGAIRTLRPALAGAGAGTGDLRYVAALVLVAGVLLTAGPAAATAELRRVIDATGLVLSPLDAGPGEGLRALIAVADGRIRDARRHLDAADAWFEFERLDPGDLGLLHTTAARALVQLDEGDLSAAATTAERLVAVADRRHLITDATVARIAQALVEAGDNEPAIAFGVLGRTRAGLLDASPSRDLVPAIDLAYASVLVRAGDRNRAERVLAVLPASTAKVLLWSKLHVHQHPGAVIRTLQQLDGLSPRLELDRQLLLAEAELSRNQARAQAPLLAAADMGYTNNLTAAGGAMPAQLLDVAEQLLPVTRDEALRWLVETHRGERAHLASYARPAGFSKGEVQLLGMLGTDLTNVEIARQLQISINTLKTRLRRLYAKLGARNRGDAVRRAVRRGLV